MLITIKMALALFTHTALAWQNILMAKYINGENVPSGEVDIRFKGLYADADGNFSGKVSVKSREW